MTTEPSGVDLARQALLAAREAARKNGATRQKPKRRTTTVVRRDGREPLGLGSAISRMMTERGMAAPAAGGSVLADFDTILVAVVPELAGRVKAVAFDTETGRLDVAPDIPAAGTQLRWSAPKLVAAANERVRGANVRALHVLAPALVKAAPATAAAEPAPQPTAPAAPMQRADPPEGYREALAAHRATWTTTQHTNPRPHRPLRRPTANRVRARKGPRWNGTAANGPLPAPGKRATCWLSRAKGSPSIAEAANAAWPFQLLRGPRRRRTVV
ncbi:DciA family protein [Streptomyces sp. NPDC088729]|uniref:DciA family protein n=1 Tax=Streptomyces sp. NPDC088729 TaxID=3365876 RepID=UPI0038009CF5